MKKYGLNELREMFLEFFEKKGHLRMESFSLIPENDPSLLLINAGMAPLKSYFTGAKKPPSKRVATCQKCIRTPDIENVGITSRHGTFFEMLGNFSFGDYFKKEAICWAWEFFIDEIGFDPNKLYISVYEEDEEAYEIWQRDINIPKERIVKLGKEENFWEHGLGPCGPCSEIYFDRGEKYGCESKDCKPGCDCDRFIEIWNLVFTQYDKDENGNYKLLPNPNIDTGMGLERLAVVCQGVENLFEVDTIRGILDEVCKYTNKKYGENKKDDISIRVITDHIRGITHMIADGVIPSNEGRGYVLRRLIRRGARHARILGKEEIFLPELSLWTIELSKDAYDNLEKRKDYIYKIIKNESEKFNETIDQGIEILFDIIEDAKVQNNGIIDGKLAFKLHDTYGFPIEIAQEIAKENDTKVDLEGFEKMMKKQKNMAREAFKKKDLAWDNDFDAKLSEYTTEFTGYDKLKDEGELLEIVPTEDNVSLIFDKTPFYANSGGQVSDEGTIEGNGVKAKIVDIVKNGDYILHIVNVLEGKFEKGKIYTLIVDKEFRKAVMRNHTVTHILQQVLIENLGEHIEQKGSYVDNRRLRFDFSHFEPVDKDGLKKIENKVNEIILEAYDVNTQKMDIKEAKESGAKALFDEKYSSKVRVVSVGKYSKELCGGTHLNNSAEAGLFKIVSESAVASGVRRIEAVTGFNAIKLYNKEEKVLNETAKVLKTQIDKLPNRINNLLEKIKSLQEENEKYKEKFISGSVDNIIDDADIIGDYKVIMHLFKDVDMSNLRKSADAIKAKTKDCILILGSVKEKKVFFVTAASDKAIKKGIHSGKIIKEIASIAGGGGGGRPDMAQAGAKDPKKVQEALDRGLEIVKDILK